MEDDGYDNSAYANPPDEDGVETVEDDRFVAPPDDDEIRRAMERFGDIPITLSVQLDRIWISVRQIMSLKVNSVVKLERSAGDNVELLMDGAPVGTGEIVVIEDLMGLRVTDLLLPKTPAQGE